MHNREKILGAIFADPKGSDRKLAKKVEMSQPTITRARTNLQKQGIFKYSVVPNLAKLGYEVIAISELPIFNTEEALKKQILQDDSIIFAIRGVHSIIALHKHSTFTDYFDFCMKHSVIESCPTTTATGIIKEITFQKP